MDLWDFSMQCVNLTHYSFGVELLHVPESNLS